MISRTIKPAASTAFVALISLASGVVHAQVSNVSEDFTGVSTTQQWYFFNGACLTAGTSTVTNNPGVIPACTQILTSYYSLQKDLDPSLVGGNKGYLGSTSAPSSVSQQVADQAGYGALRFTNGRPYGHSENGSIVSNFTFDASKGLQITFKTATYRGDSGGTGNDGADGIGFYLIDASANDLKAYSGVGALGGSLGYTCSNTNPPYDGLVGGYLGLGIDEYGNFLNGGDNTASGWGYQPNRIGLRARGSVSWAYLNATYPTYYPTSLTSTQQQQAVKTTCKNGAVYDFSKSTWSNSSGSWSSLKTVTSPSPALNDYTAIPNAYSVLSNKIAAESATTRYDTTVTPITYKLIITPGTSTYPGGLLSLSYSTGGAFSSIIKKQDITASNGTLPSLVRFGFSGSTGGSTNVHEIMCFQAAPANEGGSSATANEKQIAKFESGVQAYFAFYNPNDWTGRVAAYGLSDVGGVVSISSTATWDASCVLTGVPSGESCSTTGTSGPATAESPSSRVMLTWGGTAGIPFEWTSLTSSQQTFLNAGDSQGSNRLSFLRGDRSNEINTSGVGTFRTRDGVLGDIVDSSPVWVGPPSFPYTATWKDRLNPTSTLQENSGQSYLQFVSAQQSRPNIIYTGSNDGFVHAFRTGAMDANQNLVTTTIPNDGYEVLAYMPGAVLQSAASTSSSSACTDPTTTQTVAQNIHGVTPAIGATPSCVDATLDFSSPQYGHNFFVDASPTYGDLYYSGKWHTWLVGGLGPGGAAIYALDITDPGTYFANETTAATHVVGEWTAAAINTIGCSNGVSSCGDNLGNTYGTPQIRRLHDGRWGVIFGNGLASSTGDAGIYVMTIDSSGSKAFYYLSTGVGGGNGITYATPSDLDGDHITDYVYAGDLKGNVWRFDLTDSNESNWKVVKPALFTTQSGQPITTAVLAIATNISGSLQMMIEFGTGQKTPITNQSPATYLSTAQNIYGIWDWTLSDWNSKPNASVTYRSLSSLPSSVSAPINSSNLMAQTFTIDTSTLTNGATVAGTTTITGTNNSVCWAGLTLCGSASSSNKQFGWYTNLPNSQGTGSDEQVIYNPSFANGAFVVNSTVPTSSAPSCNPIDKGFIYVFDVNSGGAFTSVFGKNRDTNAVGLEMDGTGTPYVISTAEGVTNLIMQTIANGPVDVPIYPPSNIQAKRLTWIEKR